MTQNQLNKMFRSILCISITELFPDYLLHKKHGIIQVSKNFRKRFFNQHSC